MKKILCSVFFALVLFNIFVTSSFAQSVTQPQPTQAIKTAYPIKTDANVPQDFHTYSQNVFIEILTSISCMLTGYDPLMASGKCLGINTATRKIGYVESQGGAIGIVGSMISMTFNIPVSSSTYVKDLASNFGISKTTLAADNTTSNGFSLGYGYSGLQPVLNIWKIFRNLVYLLLVLLFIIIGLGIMFRLNIDARSVMNIQNQLPKIIIGILLVTFSYAIAGFIVDMMYVAMYIIYYIFAQPALNADIGGLNPIYLQGTNPLGAIGGFGGASDIAFGAAKPIGSVLAGIFDNSFGHIIASIVGGLIGAGAGSVIPGIGSVVGGIVGTVAGGFIGGKLLGVVGGLIAYIVITIAIIWAMLRLWFLLLRSFIFFLIDIVVAPFWIGLGLIPHAGGGFNSWIRDIVANLAVFPATLFILLLGKILISQFSSGNGTNSFVPPLIGNIADASSFGPIIGLGVILLLPGVVTMVRDTLKAPGFKYTQQIGQSLSAGSGFAKQAQGFAKDKLWKDNKMTGKPEGVKKWFYGRLSHGTGGLIGKAVTKGAVGHAGARIGSMLPIGKIKNKAKTYRGNRSVDTAVANVGGDNGTGGHSTRDSNRGNTIGGMPAEPIPGTDKVLVTTPHGQVVRDEAGLRWDAKAPVTPPTTGEDDTSDGAQAVRSEAVKTIIKGAEPEGELTETDINRIEEIMKRELNKVENKIANLSSLTAEENEKIKGIRENAKQEVMRTRIAHATPLDTAATSPSDSSE